MPGVQSYGKGRAGVGFVAADWESRAARPFWTPLTIVCSSAMRRPFYYVKGYDGAAGVALGDSSGG